MSTSIFSAIILATLCISDVSAQDRRSRSGNNSDSTVVQEIGTDYHRHNPREHVIQNTGKVYNYKDIQQMAARDINQIANTVMGVQYRVGEPVIIRGYSGGTAYFVDGVRVYGSLPILMK